MQEKKCETTGCGRIAISLTVMYQTQMLFIFGYGKMLACHELLESDGQLQI
jgi:hypothetical protein